MIELIDEYQHNPDHDTPLWWENYHFNAYDPHHAMGISLYTAIKPLLESKEDIVIIHAHPQLLFQRRYSLGGCDALSSGILKMEPLILLRKWNMHISDTFEVYEEGVPRGDTREVTVDLRFKTRASPYGFTTRRGKRYEQIGSLQGTIWVGDDEIQFKGEGMRDLSWELRNISSWGEWYWLMGRLTSGDTISFICTKNGRPMGDGWVSHHGIEKIRYVDVTPTFSSGTLEKCSAHIQTDTHSSEVLIQPMSTIAVKLGEEQKGIQGRESLVNLNNGQGYGYFWYGP
jgi:hypothetical protein